MASSGPIPSDKLPPLSTANRYADTSLLANKRFDPSLPGPGPGAFEAPTRIYHRDVPLRNTPGLQDTSSVPSHDRKYVSLPGNKSRESALASQVDPQPPVSDGHMGRDPPYSNRQRAFSSATREVGGSSNSRTGPSNPPTSSPVDKFYEDPSVRFYPSSAYQPESGGISSSGKPDRQIFSSVDDNYWEPSYGRRHVIPENQASDRSISYNDPTTQSATLRDDRPIKGSFRKIGNNTSSAPKNVAESTAPPRKYDDPYFSCTNQPHENPSQIASSGMRQRQPPSTGKTSSGQSANRQGPPSSKSRELTSQDTRSHSRVPDMAWSHSSPIPTPTDYYPPVIPANAPSQFYNAISATDGASAGTSNDHAPYALVPVDNPQFESAQNRSRPQTGPDFVSPLSMSTRNYQGPGSSRGAQVQHSTSGKPGRNRHGEKPQKKYELWKYPGSISDDKSRNAKP